MADSVSTTAELPETLRLADELRALSFGGTCILAATELRRLHAENTELRAQLETAHKTLNLIKEIGHG